jgi:hypothetical protein
MVRMNNMGERAGRLVANLRHTRRGSTAYRLSRTLEVPKASERHTQSHHNCPTNSLHDLLRWSRLLSLEKTPHDFVICGNLNRGSPKHCIIIS